MGEKKYCKLILVGVDDASKSGCAGQSNKYYEMSYSGGSTFTVNYGRVDHTKITIQKSYYEWDKIYHEKVKKGYKDVTHLVSENIVEEVADEVEIIGVDDKLIEKFLLRMKQYTDNLVSKVYSVKASSVTKAQVDEAQDLLDELADLAKATKVDKTKVNNKLVSLYTVIPRFIKNVRVEILPHIDLKKTLAAEQDNLDAMASQVRMHKPSVGKKKQKLSLLEKMEVSLKTVTDYTKDKELKKYVDQIGKSKIKGIFAVQKDSETKRFQTWLDGQNNKTTATVIHGTRCTSLIPILEQSLKIRPSGNFQFSGKAYGNGNYFSEDWGVSQGYTDHGNEKVLLVCEAHVGKPSYTSVNNYSEIKRNGYDSFAMKGYNGSGNHAMRVLYKEEQSRIKYVIWM